MRNPGCHRAIARGTLTFIGHGGADRVRFQGLLARRRALKPGTYTATITAAIAGARPSARSKLTFTIVGPTR